MKVKEEGPYSDDVAIREGMLGLDREFGAIDVGSVGTAQVHDAAAGRTGNDAGVVQGNGGVVQAQVVVGGAPQGGRFLGKLVLLGSVAAFDGEGAKHRRPAGERAGSL